jgi:hypothetical protein
MRMKSWLLGSLLAGLAAFPAAVLPSDEWTDAEAAMDGASNVT